MIFYPSSPVGGRPGNRPKPKQDRGSGKDRGRRSPETVTAESEPKRGAEGKGARPNLENDTDLTTRSNQAKTATIPRDKKARDGLKPGVRVPRKARNADERRKRRSGEKD